MVQLAGPTVFCLLNWDESEQTLSFRLSGRHRVRELLTAAELGRFERGPVSRVVPAHGGRLLACTPER